MDTSLFYRWFMKLFLDKRFIDLYRVFKYIIIGILSIFIIFLLFENTNFLGYRIHSIDKNNDRYDRGDIVLSKYVSFKSLSIGNYIVYRDKSDVKNDRIIINKIKDISFDSNKIGVITDNGINYIDSNRLIGVIIGKIPFISFLNKIFIDYIFIYIIIVTIIIIIDYLISYYRKKSEEIDVI